MNQEGSSLPWMGNCWNTSVTVNTEMNLTEKVQTKKSTPLTSTEVCVCLRGQASCRKVWWSNKSKNWASGHNDMRYVWRYKGEVFKFKNTTATVQHDGGSAVLRGCFAASGTGGHWYTKWMEQLKKEDYFQILQLHLTSTVRRLEHIETQVGVPTGQWCQTHNKTGSGTAKEG